jgi:hypothetical protein
VLRVCHDERVDVGGSEASATDSTNNEPTSVSTSSGGWQTRVVGERFGRTRIGVVVAVIAFWIVAPNMPSSAVRDELAPLWKPAQVTGLVQDWAVFSPNPRSQSVDVRARLTFDDGTISFWDVPEFDPGVGAFRQYRWHKWQERVRLDNREPFWQPTAEWIADQHLRDGVRPVRITLIRRWIDHEPLTSNGPAVDRGWNEFEFYVWERET